MGTESMGVGVTTPSPKSFYDRYFGYLVWTAILVVILGLIYAERQNSTIVWQGSCEAVNQRYGFSLTLDCDGKKIEINDNGVAFSYALNPGPLDCKTYAMGGATCIQRPFRSRSNMLHAPK